MALEAEIKIAQLRICTAGPQCPDRYTGGYTKQLPIWAHSRSFHLAQLVYKHLVLNPEASRNSIERHSPTWWTSLAGDSCRPSEIVRSCGVGFGKQWIRIEGSLPCDVTQFWESRDIMDKVTEALDDVLRDVARLGHVDLPGRVTEGRSCSKIGRGCITENENGELKDRLPKHQVVQHELISKMGLMLLLLSFGAFFYDFSTICPQTRLESLRPPHRAKLLECSLMPKDLFNGLLHFLGEAEIAGSV